MEKTREFNVHALYPGISSFNAMTIQEYYDNEIFPLRSDVTYNKHLYALSKLCEVINEPFVPMFDQWDSNIADTYLSAIECNYDMSTTLVKILKALVYKSGGTASLADIKAVNYSHIYRIPFFTFGEMDSMIRRAYAASHESIRWDTPNDWSTTIVICYLLWLGFTRREIADLGRDAYNISANFISYGNRSHAKNIFIDEPAISDYLIRYTEAAGYYEYNSYHGEKYISYIEGDTFLKTVVRDKNFTYERVEQYARKFREYFGFKADDALNAGRMNKLFYLDMMRGIDISAQNAVLISEFLGISLPRSVTRNGELGALIATYPSYKQQRMMLR